MTIPTLFFFGEQTRPVGDSYWMYVGDVLLNTLPNRWIDLFELVITKMPLKLVYEGVTEILCWAMDMKNPTE